MQPVARTAAPAGSRRARPPRALTWALAALVAAAGAAAGWALGMPGGGGATTAADRGGPSRAVRVGAVRVEVDRSWTPAGVPPELRGLRGTAFGLDRSLPATATFTIGPPGDPSLLPTGLERRLGGRGGAPSAVRIAGRTWWVSIRGLRSAQAQVAVLPTTAGMLSLVCLTPHGLPIGTFDCPWGVHAVDVPGGAVLQPASDLALRLRLPAVLDRLNVDRAAAASALLGARTPAVQAAAATDLARAHARAAAALAPVAPPTDALVGDLRAAAAAYDAVAAAARAGRAAAYDAGRREVTAAERRLAAAVAALRSSGSGSAGAG